MPTCSALPGPTETVVLIGHWDMEQAFLINGGT